MILKLPLEIMAILSPVLCGKYLKKLFQNINTGKAHIWGPRDKLLEQWRKYIKVERSYEIIFGRKLWIALCVHGVIGGVSPKMIFNPKSPLSFMVFCFDGIFKKIIIFEMKLDLLWGELYWYEKSRLKLRFRKVHLFYTEWAMTIWIFCTYLLLLSEDEEEVELVSGSL